MKFNQRQTHFMSSWTGLPCLLSFLLKKMVDAPITTGWVTQSHLSNTFLSLTSPFLAFDTMPFLLTSITEPPDRDISFAGEAGQAEMGMVFTHLLVQIEKLFQA
ncbi:hypothetical protein [Deinococcus sp. SL84]|uniref:hypothetical protein n=1 Tax=Deinococcus sp. SL84 TaxID=2994663 RepID=UPI00227627BF|nr:hypothetical protein [Deinococcus sp. SL84]MCY1704207.1 hypothetical protein [Deinococcus sp. SL84]